MRNLRDGTVAAALFTNLQPVTLQVMGVANE